MNLDRSEDDRDRLLHMVREETARLRALRIEQGAAAAPAVFPPPGSMPPPSLTRLADSAPPLEPRREYRIEDLLAFHDEDFIRNAYCGILGRAPDAQGFADFLALLRTGTMSKVEIIGRLRYSREGRAAAVTVRGLAIPFALRTVLRAPLLGRLVGIAGYVARLPEIVRDHQRLEAAVYEREQAGVRRFNAAQAELEHHLTTAHSGIGAADRRADALAAEIADIRSSVAHAGEVADRFAAVERAVASKVDNARITQLTNFLVATTDRKADRSDVDTRMERLDGRLQALVAQGDAQTGALARLETAKAERRDLQAVAEANRSWIQGLQARVKELSDAKAERAALEAVAEAHHRWIEGQQAQLERLAAMAPVAEAAGAAVEDLRRTVGEQGRALLDQARRLAELLAHARERLSRPLAPGDLSPYAREQEHLLDAFYVAFEDHFRGSREDIRERLAVYLPFVHETIAAAGGGLVIDVGCGRGEWLELLRADGLAGRGIDTNRVMIDECTQRGLEAVEADAVAHLRTLSDESVVAVTGMHVIEHLPFEALIALLDEARRVLRPGGLIVFETPNPENLIVGACNFYYDPTHHRPLPPEPMRYIAQARGFQKVEYPAPCNPMQEPPSAKDASGGAVDAINALLYGPQTYAIIARKAR